MFRRIQNNVMLNERDAEKLKVEENSSQTVAEETPTDSASTSKKSSSTKKK